MALRYTRCIWCWLLQRVMPMGAVVMMRKLVVLRCTLLVSGGGGLALVEALQAAVREERDRES